MSPPVITDISDVLKPGVFLLWNRGRVVYVGKARCLLVALAVQIMRNRNPALPDWFPIKPIHFDKLEIAACDTYRAAMLQQALVELHNPIHNRNPRPQSAPIRRLVSSPAQAERAATTGEPANAA